jgi:hypothetical protein
MPTPLEHYAAKYETIRFRREDGILEMTLHTLGDPLRWAPTAHSNLEERGRVNELHPTGKHTGSSR